MRYFLAVAPMTLLFLLQVSDTKLRNTVAELKWIQRYCQIIQSYALIQYRQGIVATAMIELCYELLSLLFTNLSLQLSMLQIKTFLTLY